MDKLPYAPKMIVNLWWKPTTGEYVPGKNLCAILHPIEINFLGDDGAETNTIDMIVEKIPEFMMPPEPKRPLGPVEMLKKNLAQEPWLSMHAMCDAMEESGDPLAVGWRMIAERKIVPVSNSASMIPTYAKLEWREDMVGKEAFKHHVISEEIATIRTVGDDSPGPRRGRKFSSIMMAWEMLAVAWTQTGGK